MSVISQSSSHLGAFVVVLMVSCLGYGQQAPSPVQKGQDASAPLAIKFQPLRGLVGDKIAAPSCGVPKGRQGVYDPETGVFHIHFFPRNYAVHGFTLTKSSAQFTKPVVFSLTGVPRAYGCLGVPLTVSVGGKSYAIEEGALAPGRVDKTLFRVERKADRVRVEFTQKGQALLKAGTAISFKVDSGW